MNQDDNLVTRLGRALAATDLDALRDVLDAPGDAGRAQLLAVLAEVHRSEVRDAIAFGITALPGHVEGVDSRWLLDPLWLDALADRYLAQETT